MHVEKTPELLAIQSELIQQMEQSLGIRDPKAKSRPFSPHMTIAFKDLKRNHFKAGWKEFQPRPFDRQFTASHLTLLRHNGQRWTIYADYPFNSRVAE
ncbi:2'-5' RNA ligase family protein [Phormidium sp. CCY1219]|uniref:2'-5' RNA ligase family protein n=1 Tax=Phormidium sp. CCY1219 TaxID=2886104 RepID=UPI002D1E9E8D|nr:2'-5' RNA ligase family protein [Phormidium sp. CCY1219]MEB3831756.1 2'-5' RNA ligase family protein [Phormidium sp. CCY1219]